jgi:hypothetical protein
VVDEDLPFDDLNFASVILVDPRGGMALADGSNSGKYSGHQNIDWNDIVSKIPKLKGLKDLLKPEPLTSEEKELIRKYQNVRVPDDANLNDRLGSDNDVELWMEVNSPRISDFQYENISSELQKKYIALGFDLSSNQIKSSKPEVLKYYVSKKVEGLKTRGLNGLSEQDVVLLNTPVLKTLKDELKPKFIQALNTSIKENDLVIEFPKSDVAKFVALYGLDEVFDSVDSESVTSLQIMNKSGSKIAVDIPETIGRFGNLETLFIENFAKSIPNSISECKSLQFITLHDNIELEYLPWDIINNELTNVTFLMIKDSPRLEFPADFNEHWDDISGENTSFMRIDF